MGRILKPTYDAVVASARCPQCGAPASFSVNEEGMFCCHVVCPNCKEVFHPCAECVIGQAVSSGADPANFKGECWRIAKKKKVEAKNVMARGPKKITAERAIELLRCRDGVNFTLDEYCEAVDMAVEALKQQGASSVCGDDRQETDVFKDAINEFGEAAQVLMVFEEMSELQKELCKWLRNGATRALVQNIAEEIADVEIMLAQMKILFEVGSLVERYRRGKTMRLASRVEEAKKNRGGETNGKS